MKIVAFVFALAALLSDSPRPVKVKHITMNTTEWTRAYDDCVKRLKLPVILANPTPGISAGVGCAEPAAED